jgi:hypothetical protein
LRHLGGATPDPTYNLNGGFKPTMKRFADLEGPDFFPTPRWATFALIDNEKFKGTFGNALAVTPRCPAFFRKPDVQFQVQTCINVATVRQGSPAGRGN